MRYVFDACVLDTDRRELRRDDDMVAVEPQVFDLIAYLIRNRDRVVDRDDLRAAIWSGRIVSESTLNTRINAARSAVGDSGDEQRLIRTLPRKGFRFVGDVREDDAALPQPDTAADRAPASGADRQVAVWQADGDVTPAPQPVPKMTPNTTPNPVPAPSVASLRAKQLASFSTRTSRSRASLIS